MKRFIYNELKEWKLSATRKPLIIYGARQAGDSVVPMEVKAEVSVKAKSLYNFINVDYASQHYKGLRLSMRGFQDQGWMANAPLCAAREVVSMLTGKCYLCK